MKTLGNILLIGLVVGVMPSIAVGCLKCAARGELLGYFIGLLLTLCVVISIIQAPKAYKAAIIGFTIPGRVLAVYAFRRKH